MCKRIIRLNDLPFVCEFFKEVNGNLISEDAAEGLTRMLRLSLMRLEHPFYEIGLSLFTER